MFQIFHWCQSANWEKELPRVLMLVTWLIVSSSNPSFAADHSGQWFFLWGYNRAAYDESDIHFRGNDYDFILKDVKADDYPSRFRWKYVFPDVTIPQTNIRFG